MASIIHTANVQGPLTKSQMTLARFNSHNQLINDGFYSIGTIRKPGELDYAHFYRRDSDHAHARVSRVNNFNVLYF